jgi:hypothetical protein
MDHSTKMSLLSLVERQHRSLAFSLAFDRQSSFLSFDDDSSQTLFHSFNLFGHLCVPFPFLLSLFPSGRLTVGIGPGLLAA